MICRESSSHRDKKEFMAKRFSPCYEKSACSGSLKPSFPKFTCPENLLNICVTSIYQLFTLPRAWILDRLEPPVSKVLCDFSQILGSIWVPETCLQNKFLTWLRK